MRTSRVPQSRQPAASQRGAVLIHVVVAMIGLLGFSSFVIDYGVLWAARRQAQNSADAAAMAAAVSLGFVDADNQALARTAALNTAAVNPIWGASPDITPADVTFPVCPPGAPGAGTNTCVRVDVFRNQRAGGNPLPSLFGTLVGVVNQGVRATATAEVVYGNSTNCVKPFAIPDKWIEAQTPEWDLTDSFSRYVQNGSDRGALVPNPDSYVPPASDGSDNGSGFDVTDNYGMELTIKNGTPNGSIQPGWYYPVVINPDEGPGGDNYRDNIATCDPTVVGVGTVLEMEPGNMIGPTQQGIDRLINLDLSADWGQDENGDWGVQGGCMAASTPCALSPRVVAVPVFNPDAWDEGQSQGRGTVVVTRVVGMFIDRIEPNGDVIGYLMPYPSAPYGGTGGTPGSSFVVSIILVR
jgi:hypothetical protein